MSIDLELQEIVFGPVADPNASNRGHLNGALVLLSNYGIAAAVFYLLFRYHIYERHIQHVMSVVLGKNKCPSNKAYETYIKEFPSNKNKFNAIDKRS